MTTLWRFLLQGKDATIIDRKPQQSDFEKEKLPFDRKKPLAQTEEGMTAICCDWLAVRGARQSKRNTVEESQKLIITND